MTEGQRRFSAPEPEKRVAQFRRIRPLTVSSSLPYDPSFGSAACPGAIARAKQPII